MSFVGLEVFSLCSVESVSGGVRWTQLLPDDPEAGLIMCRFLPTAFPFDEYFVLGPADRVMIEMLAEAR